MDNSQKRLFSEALLQLFEGFKKALAYVIIFLKKNVSRAISQIVGKE